MKLAVFSDIHENFHNLLLALESAREENVEYILCLGDLINAGIAKVLAIQDIQVHMIWGNNDGEKVEVLNAAAHENSNLSVALTVYDFLEIGGRKIFMTHYDNLAYPMAASGMYDAVFYGHNHIKKIDRLGETLVVNPGEIGGQKTGIASYAVYDAIENSCRIIELDGAISLKSAKVDDYFRKNKEELAFRCAKSFGLDK